MKNKDNNHAFILVKKLKQYFLSRNDVDMAFLFGSLAKDTAHEGSDADIAVYFNCEFDDEFESAVWADVEKIIGINVDFIVLNHAFPLIAESAMKGIPIIIKNRSVYLSFLLKAISEAIDYRAFVESFWRLKQRRANVS